MKKRAWYRVFPFGITVICLCVLCSFAVAADVSIEPVPIEPIPIELRSAEVLPGTVLAGPRYEILPKVTSDGFVNSYELKTSYGSLTVRSTGLLQERLKEVNALYLMEQIEKSEVFKESMKKAAMGPLNTAKGLVTEPVDTVVDTVSGVGRWVSDVGRSVFSGDPDQEGVVKTALGQAAAKRQFAYEFNIDPYSRWEPVQERLNEIAWAATGGGLTVKLAFTAIPESAGLIVRATGTSDSMRKLVRDSSVGELRKINEKKLKDMGVDSDLIEAFLENPHYTPLETTLLVGELKSLPGLGGVSVFLEKAARADSPSVALFMRIRAQMLASYAANVAPVKEIIALNGTPFALRKDGVVVGLFPLDYLAWTHAIWSREWAVSDSLAKESGISSKELWISGVVTPAARKALEAKGWKIVENVGYLPKKR